MHLSFSLGKLAPPSEENVIHKNNNKACPIFSFLHLNDKDEKTTKKCCTCLNLTKKKEHLQKQIKRNIKG